LAVALLGASLGATAADLQGCRLPRIAQEVRCGQVEVAENPRAPDGRRLRIQFAVVPALAKNKAPDPLFVLAGGPGQSARQVAGAMLPVLARVNARHDLVFVDQRGTGGSHPLTCPQPKVEPLASSLDPRRQLEALRACVAALPADTRHYATWLAARDFDAVREALGAAQINLWGASYGSRLALEYLRQFPQRVRSVVLDGVAPPDMALPASFAVDAEASLSALLAACERDTACRARHPRLAQRLDGLFGRLTQAPLPITVAHPLTGEPQAFALTRDMLAAALRVPLYAPTLAALLPHAIERAAQQDFAPLLALPVAAAADEAARVAIVQHYAVICAEDLPRIDAAARRAAAATRFGTTLLQQYEAACARVPHGPAPPEFYALSGAAVPVLLLSGALDPVTPPRHGERVARALANARHLVAPHLAHGISAHGCGPELIARFVRQAHFDGIDGACLQRLPAPPFFVPPALADR
ncbi:MAG: alpha/beta hydrolase, partial [Burkholderiaceae bacterium]|nr:alpha/beta hydrolase [Burkholderiaceae bacterium]